MFVLLLVFSTAFVGATEHVSVHQQIAEYQAPWIVERLTFDPSRMSKKDLDRIVQLSPALGPYNFMLVPESIQLCKSGNPQYQNCGHPTSFNLHNARLNLQAIADRIKALDPSSYPPQLRPVVAYIVALQKFSLWRETQKLKFLQSDDISALETSYKVIDPQQSCRDVLAHIRETIGPESRYAIAAHDWSNCVLDAARPMLGQYPRAAWNAFLRDYGIQEQTIDTAGDDE